MIIHHVRLKLAGGDPTVPARDVGHSFRAQLTAHLDDEHAQALSVGPGVCCTAETEAAVSGDGECQPDSLPLHPIHTYEDLFTYHDASQQPTTRTLVAAGDHTQQAQPPEDTASTAGSSGPDTTQEWYYHTYVDTGCEALRCTSLTEDTVTGLELTDADARITGIDTQPVDIDAIDYGHLETADSHVLTFRSPYVYNTTAPDTSERSIESWLRRSDAIDRRSLAVAIGDERYECTAIAAGQRAVYDGTSPIATAKMGILGMGLHAEYGFGGVRVWTPGGEETGIHYANSQAGESR